MREKVTFTGPANFLTYEKKKKKKRNHQMLDVMLCYTNQQPTSESPQLSHITFYSLLVQMPSKSHACKSHFTSVTFKCMIISPFNF